MGGLKNLASGVFPESWKIVGRMAEAAAEMDQNKSPDYPGWFK